MKSIFRLTFAICLAVSTVGVKLDENHDWNTSLKDAGQMVDTQDGGQFITEQGQNHEPPTADILNLNEEDMPEYSQKLLKRAEWKYYPYKWCTAKGRVLIAYYLKTYQQCQQRCLQKPGCKAIERWSKSNYACFECTKPLLMTPYTNTRDLAYPAHVWVLQTPNDQKWKFYPNKWCTSRGRVLIAYYLKTYQQCQQRCLQKPGCKAIERWSKDKYHCFECTKPSLMTPYTNTRDLAYPAHVWVLKEVNECLKKPCKNGASCVDLSNGYKCNCKSGYSGKNCENDINECAASPCQNGASCTNLPGSYRCTCKTGFTGLKCQSDVNECAVNKGGCSHECTNNFGSFACSCPDPELKLAPDKRTCEASGVSVDCHQNKMSITLPKTLLRGMSPEHLTLADEKCVATETKTHYTLTTPLTGCGTIARHAKDAVLYTNRVLEIPVKNDAIITRQRETEIPFSCFYKNSGDAVAVGVKPDTRKLVFEEDGKGNFTVALELFKDEKFASLYTAKDFPVDVKLRANLFFQASVLTKDKNLSILAEHCYATPSANQNDALKYELIKDGCPVDTTTVIITSTPAATNRFKTEAFKFIGNHPFVLVYCHIRICDAANKESRCAQGCLKKGRKTRDIITSKSNDEDKLYPLAQGPIMLAEEEGELVKEASTTNGVTVPAVVAMAILSAVCLTGMAYFGRRRSKQIFVYDPISTSYEN